MLSSGNLPPGRQTNRPTNQQGPTRLGPGLALFMDCSAWIVSIPLAAWIRFDFALTATAANNAVALALLGIAVQVVVGYTQYVYRGRHGTGSFDEVRAVTATVGATAGALLLADLAAPGRLVPASVPISGGMLALILMLAGRYAYRFRRELWLRRGRGHGSQPVIKALLFGAGYVGHSFARAILLDPRNAYVPVGVIDDDPMKRRLRVHGLPVLGDRHDIPAALARTGATTVIFSVGNADGDLIREIQNRTLDAGAAFKVVPTVRELLEGPAALTDVRDMRVKDLLGRRQIETDLAPIAGYLTGKRVLVTGAGGSIGSELCRRISVFGPSELIMLDRDESALHGVQLSLHGRALLDSSEVVLADLRDYDAMRDVFATRRPQVVFHAAALKHLPLLERHPGEAVKTNVWGTQTLLELSRGVERFVNISTDKAANPTSVLGCSKRITERLTAHAAMENDGVFLTVRFGNVLGSRGSVLTAFDAQAAAGGPITVTHPDVTRYFMTVQEAVQLVIQAAAIGRSAEALVLDMGKPVRIDDVARQIARQVSHPVEIVYTGLRPGEKLHEELFGDSEVDRRPLHPLISHVTVPPLHPAQARVLDPSASPGRIIADLMLTAAHSDVSVARTTGFPPENAGGTRTGISEATI